MSLCGAVGKEEEMDSEALTCGTDEGRGDQTRGVVVEAQEV